MKLNVLEAHDRLIHLIKDQEASIWEGANDCLTKNSLSLELQEESPYIYIFAHPRTSDDGLKKRMYWQPRISKPKPQTNSYLFRAISKTDIIEICWLLPPRECWEQYKKGNVTESNWTLWSINQFKFNRKSLGKPEIDDLPEHIGQKIYKKVIKEHIEKLKIDRNKIIMPNSLEHSLIYF